MSVGLSLWAKKKYIYIYLPVKLAKSKEKTQQRQQHSLGCASPPLGTFLRPTHSQQARTLRAPFHWQRVDVVAVCCDCRAVPALASASLPTLSTRSVTASKINARITLPTLLPLLFLLLLWRTLNPTHTLTHTYTGAHS